ncbi:YitT family protein [Persicobacter psychrovividus]
MTVGIFLHCLGWSAFIIPNKISSGGLTGVSTVIYYATSIPVAYSYLLINVFLIALGIKILGPRFGSRTIYGVLMSSFLFYVMPMVISAPFVKDLFLSVVVGSAMSGFGIALVLSQGGSMGGTDIVAMIVNKYRNISPGRIMLYCDVLIISASFLVLKKVEAVVYAGVIMFVISYMVDLVLTGEKQSVQVMVFSEHEEEIASQISKRFNRGLTVIHGRGYFTNKERQILMIMARKAETNGLLDIITSADPKAFVSVGQVMGVYGEGFEAYRR